MIWIFPYSKQYSYSLKEEGGFPGDSVVKNPPTKEKQETWVRLLGQEDPMEQEMATYSSILAWVIPWTEETGRLSDTLTNKAVSSARKIPSCLLTHSLSFKSLLK